MIFKTIESTDGDKNNLLNQLKSEKLNKEHHANIPECGTKIDISKFENSIPEVKEIEAEVVRDSNNNEFLKWRCSPKYKNKLLINGRPFRARSINWRYGIIKWSAWVEGRGRTFEIPCPNVEYGNADILIQISGSTYKRCQTHNLISGHFETEVYFYVSDSIYRDNRGFFEVIVTSYSE